MMNKTTSTVIANTTYSNTTEKSVNLVSNEITKPSEVQAQSSPPTTKTDNTIPTSSNTGTTASS